MEKEDFKKKRIDFLNNWPNSDKFEIEKEYSRIVEQVKGEHGPIFHPYKLPSFEDVYYNIMISFVIEALEQLETHPNLSFELIFQSYDCFIDNYYSELSNITDKTKALCDNEWKSILNSNKNVELRDAFNKLLSNIPVKACQYLYTRIYNKNKDKYPYARVTSDISGGQTYNSKNRKCIIDAINNKYGFDYNDYSATVRKASLLYRYIFKHDSVTIDKEYCININDKLHIIVSGYLYTLRNDMMHGSNIAIMKSSKTTLSTLAVDYFAFLILYYLIIMLVIYKYSCNDNNLKFNELALNIQVNLDLYIKMFGKSIDC